METCVNPQSTAATSSKRAYAIKVPHRRSTSSNRAYIVVVRMVNIVTSSKYVYIIDQIRTNVIKNCDASLKGPTNPIRHQHFRYVIKENGYYNLLKVCSLKEDIIKGMYMMKRVVIKSFFNFFSNNATFRINFAINVMQIT